MAGDGVKCRVKGGWSAEEDKRLAEYVGVHGPSNWKSVAIKSGVKRCGKSCRLRWLNYLRPDIKRGCISHVEDDLILRFHRLLGNRWSLIAKRLPGRTDNEIKNYWNAHLKKKAKLMDKLPATATAISISTPTKQHNHIWNHEESIRKSGTEIHADTQGQNRQCGLDWVKTFLQLDQEHAPPIHQSSSSSLK